MFSFILFLTIRFIDEKYFVPLAKLKTILFRRPKQMLERRSASDDLDFWTGSISTTHSRLQESIPEKENCNIAHMYRFLTAVIYEK